MVLEVHRAARMAPVAPAFELTTRDGALYANGDAHEIERHLRILEHNFAHRSSALSAEKPGTAESLLQRDALAVDLIRAGQTIRKTFKSGDRKGESRLCRPCAPLSAEQRSLSASHSHLFPKAA